MTSGPTITNWLAIPALAAPGAAKAAGVKTVAAERLADRGGTRLEYSTDLAAEIHRFVARQVPNPDDAADIAQQSLLLACAGIRNCRNENLSPWLHMIARHQIVDYHRAQNRRPFVQLSAGLAETEAALQTRPDTALAAGECRERLQSLLGDANRCVRLEHQVALLLADAYGHDDKHSAAVLRMSLPCFKLLLHRARASLRGIGPSRGRARQAGCHGVTCHLKVRDLLRLRRELLDGLKP